MSRRSISVPRSPANSRLCAPRSRPGGPLSPILLLGLICLVAPTGAHADYASSVLGFRPITYWRLEEQTAAPAGDRARNAGSLEAAADGYYQGTAYHPVNGALAGRIDAAAAFDGSYRSCVVVPHDARLNPATTFTVECWVNPNTIRPDDDNVQCPIGSIRREPPDASGWVIYQAASGWRLRMGNTSGYQLTLTSSTKPAPGYWDHLVAVFENKTARLYVNGALEATGSFPGTFEPNANVPLGIGARGDGNFGFNGMVDEVAFYGTALSATGIQNHFRTAVSTSSAPTYAQVVLGDKPLAYYRLNETAYQPPASLPRTANWGTAGSQAEGAYSPGTLPARPGPRPPPAFAFATNNFAFGFNGAVGQVTTRYQLNSLSRFTLLGWLQQGSQRGNLGGVFGQSGVIEFGVVDQGATLAARIAVHDAWIRVPNPFPDGEWGFVAIVGDGSKVVLYTNSVAAGTLAGSVITYGSSGSTFNLGGGVFQAAGDTFRGAVDEVAVIERALSPEEVAQVYNSAGLAPKITVQPTAPAQPVFAGNTVSFAVTALGTPDLLYQWRRDGQALNGRTASTLVLEKVKVEDSGAIDVVVRNGFGAVTSVVVQLDIQPVNPPVILKAPEPRTRFVDSQVAFAVEAGGSPPLTYQWQFNGQNLPGQTETNLVLSNLQPSQDGLYRVIVRNPVDPVGVASDAARLTVIQPGAYSAAVLSDQPVAYWRLGELSGSLANDGWGGHDGEYHQAALGQPGFSVADTNTAVGLSAAVGSGVVIPNATNFDFVGLAPSFTLEAWARFEDVSGTQTLVSHRQLGLDSQGGYAFSRLGHTNLVLTAYGVQDLLSPPLQPTLQAEKWYHLVATVDHGLVLFYVNGTVVGSGYSFFGALRSSSTPLTLGRHPQSDPTDAVMDGRLDEVAVYAHALSPSRVRAHYDTRYGAGTKPVFTTAPEPARVYSLRPARFRAIAEGSDPIRYQWSLNGKPMAGATSETFTVTLGPGNYAVVCSAANAAGTATTQPVSLTVLTTPNSCDLTPGLVAHLKFDGDYVDASGHQNHGTPFGAPAFVSGMIGTRALRYLTDTGTHPKTYNYVSLGNPSDLQFGTNASFSVAFWIRFQGTPGDLPFLANNDEALDDAGIALTPSPFRGGWAWSLKDAQATSIASALGYADPEPNTLNNGAWRHLTFTFDRTGNATTYVDGQPVHSMSIRSAATWNLTTGQPFTIGQAGGLYGESGVVEMDDLGIWRRVLSPFEVDTLYLVGLNWGGSFAPDQTALRVERIGGLVYVSWTSGGTLERASHPQGPWSAIPGAKSPYNMLPNQAAQYFRVKL